MLATILKEPVKSFLDSSSLDFLRRFASLGASLISMFIAFGLLYWIGMARIVCGQVFMLKQQEYVAAAKCLGAGRARIIRRHLLPNCMGQIIVTTSLQIPQAIFLESFLSFLGSGIQPPMASLRRQ